MKTIGLTCRRYNIVPSFALFCNHCFLTYYYKLTSSDPKYSNLQIQVVKNPKLKMLDNLTRTTARGNRYSYKSKPTMATLFVEYDKGFAPNGQDVKNAWVAVINKYDPKSQAPCGMLNKE